MAKRIWVRAECIRRFDWNTGTDYEMLLTRRDGSTYRFLWSVSYAGLPEYAQEMCRRAAFAYEVERHVNEAGE